MRLVEPISDSFATILQTATRFDEGLSLKILDYNQLDALFHVFIYFISLRVSSITVLIIRRANCVNTASGMISLYE